MYYQWAFYQLIRVKGAYVQQIMFSFQKGPIGCKLDLSDYSLVLQIGPVWLNNALHLASYGLNIGYVYCTESLWAANRYTCSREV